MAGFNPPAAVAVDDEAREIGAARKARS